MTESTTFSSRSNAKRAAEKAIEAGTAPSIDYGIKQHASGRFEIVWKDRAEEARARLGMPPAEADGDELKERFDSWESETQEDKVETEIAEAAADTSVDVSDGEQTMADRFPPGTRVIVQESKRKRRAGAVDYRVDATSCRVKFDGPHPSVLCRYNQLTLDDGSEPLPAEKAPRKRRAAPSGDRKPSKSFLLDAQAATGAMPAKPIITSAANQKQYQPRFDKLEAMAMAGDWDGVHGYEVNGINSYAKMVKQYRERLLAAHAAQQAAKTEAA
jgi:hypothetical protein